MEPQQITQLITGILQITAAIAIIVSVFFTHFALKHIKTALENIEKSRKLIDKFQENVIKNPDLLETLADRIENDEIVEGDKDEGEEKTAQN